MTAALWFSASVRLVLFRPRANRPAADTALSVGGSMGRRTGMRGDSPAAVFFAHGGRSRQCTSCRDRAYRPPVVFAPSSAQPHTDTRPIRSILSLRQQVFARRPSVATGPPRLVVGKPEDSPAAKPRSGFCAFFCGSSLHEPHNTVILLIILQFAIKKQENFL